MQKPFSAYRGDDAYVFVSYAHDDADSVYPELSWLNAQGFNVWYDEGIAAGSSWREEIARAIAGASLVVFFVSERAAQSVNCQREVDFALDEGLPLVVVHLEPTTLPEGMRLSLGPIQAIHRYELAERDYRRRLIDGLAGKVAVTNDLLRAESTPRGFTSFAVVAIAAMLVGGLVSWQWITGGASSLAVERYRVPMPEGASPLVTDTSGMSGVVGKSFAISGDGNVVAFVANTSAGRRLLRWRRGALTAEPVALYETGLGIALDLTGEAIVQGAATELRRYGFSTGLRSELLPGRWLGDPDVGLDGSVAFHSEAGLHRLDAISGEVQLLVENDETFARRFAYPIPGGRGVFYTKLDRVTRAATLAIYDFTANREIEIAGGIAAAATDEFLLYYADEQVWAVRYEADSLVLTSEPIAFLEQAAVDVSAAGDLVYISNSIASMREPALVTRDGEVELLGLEPGRYHSPRLSPDGDEIVFGMRPDLWVFSLTTKRLRRLTMTDRGKGWPLWTNDGTEIIFTGVGEDNMNVFRTQADRTSEPTEILNRVGLQTVGGDFLPDGRLLAREALASDQVDSVVAIDLEANTVDLLFENAWGPELHPSGRWIAYTSNIDGEPNVYIRPFPAVDRLILQVTTDGAVHPRWSRDGTELYFVATPREGPQLTAAAIEISDDELEIGSFDALFPIDSVPPARRAYEPLDDGRFFVFPFVESRAELIYVRNGIAELERLLPE